jgi:hypothetical protein
MLAVMLHRGKAQPDTGVAPGATASGGEAVSGGKVLAPRAFLGFNLNKMG